MITEAIILAGGLGTRLREAVPGLPKCMAPVAGKPFISYLIDYYAKQGIELFVLSVGYMHEVIEQYLQSEFSKLNYIISREPEPLGTGGAVMQACPLCKTENVLILNGDTLFEVNLPEIASFHETNDAECTLALKEMNNTDRYGVVEMETDGRITSFREKKFYSQSLINGGCYALNVPSFRKQNFPTKFSFEKDYFEKVYNTRRIYGIVQKGYFIDIGIPSDYEKAQTDFLNK